MVEAGAAVVDLGGMSTAPFKSTWVSEELEADRLMAAVKSIRDELGHDVIISIDSFRPKVVERVVRLGIDIINDVTGLWFSETLADVAADNGLQMILCARELQDTGRDPIKAVIDEGRRAIQVAARHGVEDVIIDPCIGFPPITGDPSINPLLPLRGNRYGNWAARDVYVLSHVNELRKLGKPLCVGASRKGFIRKSLGRGMGRELGGSLGVAAYLVMRGVDLIRVHDVEETVDLVRIMKIIEKCEGKGFNECLGTWMHDMLKNG